MAEHDVTGPADSSRQRPCDTHGVAREVDAAEQADAGDKQRQAGEVAPAA